MSLHELAGHIQKAGRGEDTVLIHMTPKEVDGLQQLAMSHGGSLTINPETGLVEAGFLSSILPMVAGLALGPAGFGVMSAMGAAATVGGIAGLASGSLKQGLMAGLGAYGGANLGTALAGEAAATSGALNGSVMANAQNASTLGNLANTTTNLATPFSAGTTALNGSVMANAPGTIQLGASAVPGIGAVAPQSLNAASQITPMSNWDKLASGASKAAAHPLDFIKAHPWEAGGLGLTALQAMQQDYKAPPVNQGMIRPYTFDRTQNQEAYATNTPVYGQPFDSRERNYFNDTYTALKPYAAPGPEYNKAVGGLTALAVGGPVEEMSAQNAMSTNTGYPMANLETSAYANPQISRPVANNIVSASGDAGVDPYTGEARFAEGGTTGGYSYDYNPQTQQFTQTGKPTPVMPSRGGFMGTGSMGFNGNPYNSSGIMGQALRSAQASAPAEAPVVTGGVQAPAQTYQPQAYQPAQQQPLPAYQSPEQQLGLEGFYDYMRQQMNGMQGYAAGGSTNGEYNLGDYSDGGRLLRGPGDGVSDDIPASIGGKQEARLADGEFVVPARIVSELGNGSTEAGARQLYKMMERVQHNRKKTVGKDNTAVDSKSAKFLPA